MNYNSNSSSSSRSSRRLQKLPAFGRIMPPVPADADAGTLRTVMMHVATTSNDTAAAPLLLGRKRAVETMNMNSNDDPSPTSSAPSPPDDSSSRSPSRNPTSKKRRTSTTSRPGGRDVVPFPVFLRRMISASTTPALQWTADGSAFWLDIDRHEEALRALLAIHRPNMKKLESLKKIIAHNYGFSNIASTHSQQQVAGSSSDDAEKMTGCLFHHTHFHRDKFSDEELAENFRNSYSKTKPTAFTAPTSTVARPKRSQVVFSSCPAPVSSPSILSSSSSSSSKKNTENPPFPVALRRMISASTTPALQWTADGSAFWLDIDRHEEALRALLAIHRPNMKKLESLKKIIAHNYGFSNITSTVAQEDLPQQVATGANDDADVQMTGSLFHHAHFHRDKFSDEELAENCLTKRKTFTAPTAVPPQQSQVVLSASPASAMTLQPVSSPSTEIMSSSSSSSKKKTENPPFPVALRRMISASTTPALQWTQDGSALSVDQTQVEEIQTLLQQYFPSMTTPTSLVRKMYSFGFRGMRREPGASTNSSSSHDHLEHDKESKITSGVKGSILHHPSFHRDHLTDEQLSANVVPKSRNHSKKAKDTKESSSSSSCMEVEVASPELEEEEMPVSVSNMSSKSAKTERQPFPVILRRMISASTTPALQWTQDGSAVGIDFQSDVELKRLLREYMPTLTLPMSLRKKMVHYGFEKVVMMQETATAAPDEELETFDGTIFRHSYFHRDHGTDEELAVTVVPKTKRITKRKPSVLNSVDVDGSMSSKVGMVENTAAPMDMLSPQEEEEEEEEEESSSPSSPPRWTGTSTTFQGNNNDHASPRLPFPVVLRRMISSSSTSALEWVEGGSAFRIDMEPSDALVSLFASHLLTMKKPKALRARLYEFGFKMMIQPLDRGSDEEEEESSPMTSTSRGKIFHHPSFHRDRLTDGELAQAVVQTKKTAARKLKHGQRRKPKSSRINEKKDEDGDVDMEMTDKENHHHHCPVESTTTPASQNSAAMTLRTEEMTTTPRSASTMTTPPSMQGFVPISDISNEIDECTSLLETKASLGNKHHELEEPVAFRVKMAPEVTTNASSTGASKQSTFGHPANVKPDPCTPVSGKYASPSDLSTANSMGGMLPPFSTSKDLDSHAAMLMASDIPETPQPSPQEQRYFFQSPFTADGSETSAFDPFGDFRRDTPEAGSHQNWMVDFFELPEDDEDTDEGMDEAMFTTL